MDYGTEDTVLVVDDAAVMRAACGRALRRAGFEVMTAKEGAEAMFMLKRKPASAILLDLKMPVMTGLEFTRLARELWPKTEIVVMTAYADSPMVEQTRKLGAMRVITKPFESLRALTRNVAMAITKSKLRRGMAIDSTPLLHQIFVATGWIMEYELEKAMARARADRVPPRSAMADVGLVGEEDFERALAMFLDIPCVSISPELIPLEPARRFPLELARKLSCFPIREGNGCLDLVVDNPYDDEAMDEIADAVGGPVRFLKGRKYECCGRRRPEPPLQPGEILRQV